LAKIMSSIFSYQFNIESCSSKLKIGEWVSNSLLTYNTNISNCLIYTGSCLYSGIPSNVIVSDILMGM